MIREQYKYALQMHNEKEYTILIDVSYTGHEPSELIGFEGWQQMHQCIMENKLMEFKAQEEEYKNI